MCGGLWLGWLVCWGYKPLRKNTRAAMQSVRTLLPKDPRMWWLVGEAEPKTKAGLAHQHPTPSKAAVFSAAKYAQVLLQHHDMASWSDTFLLLQGYELKVAWRIGFTNDVPERRRGSKKRISIKESRYGCIHCWPPSGAFSRR